MLRHFIFCILCCVFTLSALSQHQSRVPSKKAYPGFDEDVKAPISVRLIVNDSTSLLQWAKNHPASRITRHHHNVFTVTGISKNDVTELLAFRSVKFIDKGDRKAHEETVLGEFDMTLNAVSKLQSLKPELNGEQITVSIKEKPFDTDDLDLRGRIVLNEQFDEAASLHATIMATVVAGAGNTSSEGKGVAPAAQVTTSDFASLMPDDAEQLLGAGISLQNHSYGVGVENYYGIESSEYDRSVYENPVMLHVFSSGNDGDQTLTTGYYANIPAVANLTGQFKVSKNSISVGSSDRYGNIVTRSSRGPAYDGRVKPELMAYGDAGSSEACAVVSGIATLIQDHFQRTYGNLPDAALVKALLINGAVDTGREHVDFETGYGNVHALNSIRAIDDERFLSGSVLQAEEMTFVIDIPASVSFLKATLVWTDPPADPFEAQALINNLDFEIISPTQSYLPWVLNSSNTLSALQSVATRGVDNINNVEQITIDSPAEGLHTFKVTGSDVTDSQKFFIVYEFRSGFEWISPTVSDPLVAGNANILRWSWNNSSVEEGQLEFRYASEDEWVIISESVDLSKHYYEWDAPDTSAILQFKFNVAGEEQLSELVVLNKPQRLQVGYNCDEQIMFYWDKVPSATSYTLYSLGEKYLEPFLTTPDTFAVIDKPSPTNFFSVASVFNDISGSREATINFNTQGVDCYFKTFLPQATHVFDTAFFDVSLGTIYNLKSAELQLLTNGEYQTVSFLTPVDQTDFPFYDPVTRSGNQTYRVKLTTMDDRMIYSDEAGVLFVSASDVYIYPNPVFAEEDLSVIVQSEDIAVMELYDSRGVFVRRFEDFGIVKTISTSRLTAGIYILRVMMASGMQRHGRIIVK
jgi:hypothetical protein